MMKKIWIAAMTIAMGIMTVLPAQAAEWQQTETGWKYAEESGFAVNGWREITGHWYYFDQNGMMMTGWQQINGKWYFFYDSGNMATNWVKLGETWFFFYPDGSMASGESYIGGRMYTLDSEGRYIRDGVHRDGLEDDLLEKAMLTYIDSRDDVAYLIALTNNVRRKAGVGDLLEDPIASVAAIYRGLEMEKYDYVGHYVDGIPMCERAYFAIRGNHDGVRGCGENIHVRYGMTDPDTQENDIVRADIAIQRLTESPEHFENMVIPKYKYVGCGPVYNEDRTHYYMTQIFRSK